MIDDAIGAIFEGVAGAATEAVASAVVDAAVETAVDVALEAAVSSVAEVAVSTLAESAVQSFVSAGAEATFDTAVNSVAQSSGSSSFLGRAVTHTIIDKVFHPSHHSYNEKGEIIKERRDEVGSFFIMLILVAILFLSLVYYLTSFL